MEQSLLPKRSRSNPLPRPRTSMTTREIPLTMTVQTTNAQAPRNKNRVPVLWPSASTSVDHTSPRRTSARPTPPRMPRLPREQPASEERASNISTRSTSLVTSTHSLAETCQLEPEAATAMMNHFRAPCHSLLATATKTFTEIIKYIWTQTNYFQKKTFSIWSNLWFPQIYRP